MTKINNEKDLYPLVKKWLRKFLKDRHRRSKVETYDTHNVSVSKFLLDKKLQTYFTELSAYDIKVDVTGIIISKKAAKLAFVECKIKPITLKDVGQILGYSRVANPAYSFIVSPKGLSSPLSILLRTFGRYDVLAYQDNKKIRIAKWNLNRMEIEYNSLLPPGEYY